jgi:uncharacterized surface protein with fasciclin (FAS1) repeats
MKLNYSRLLTNFASVVSLAGVSFLISLPSGAKQVLNPNPSIFQEPHYNRSQSTPDSVTQLTKDNNKKPIAQTPGDGKLNPRPSIFNEPPYNRGSRTTPTEVAPSPSTKPTAPETPAAGTTDTQNKTLLALAESNGSFTVLTQAIKAAGLSDALQGKDNLTVFAPTDEAFKKLPQDALQELLKPENKEVLVKILTYHVVPGSVASTDLKSGEVKSLEGGVINVKVDPQNGVTVNEAKVIQADIKGSNGIIHVINEVILPPDL